MLDTARTFHLGHAMLPDGWATDVRLSVVGGKIVDLQSCVPPAIGDERIGVGLPGMPNLHSHAFQRGIAGLAEIRTGHADSFWTWREIMYRFVDRLTPDDLRTIAALAYAEMLEGGFTRVGEFHYLHHDCDGASFANVAEMSAAIFAAAHDTHIALTHLPVFYAHSGFGGAAPTHGQRRFVNDIDRYMRILDWSRATASDLPDAVVGIAPHSLRAVSAGALSALIALSPVGPVHIHIAEQTREVDDCIAWSGARPVEWLLANAAVDARWCLVHATHLIDREIVRLAASEAVAGLCPITEANLGDGIFPAVEFDREGGRFGIGSDSNVLIDATEELRLLEYGQRLTRRSRNVLAGTSGHTGYSLYAKAVAGGAAALGATAGLAIGAAADIVTLDTRHPALAARTGPALVDAFVFAAGTRAIDCVWRGGVKVVEGGRHHRREAIVQNYTRTLAKLLG